MPAQSVRGNPIPAGRERDVPSMTAGSARDPLGCACGPPVRRPLSRHGPEFAVARVVSATGGRREPRRLPVAAKAATIIFRPAGFEGLA
jgi:hypothetical protein